MRATMDSRKRARVEESSGDDQVEVESINNGDRISRLCDELLYEICSFLRTREVVQTCALSKRWRNLWRSVPCLDFDQEEYLLASSHAAGSRTSNFSTLLHNAMLFRDDGSDIQKLRLSCDYQSNNTSHVFSYISIALEHNLQVLDLKILEPYRHIPVLPWSIFTSESLTCLKLNNVVLPSSNLYCCCMSSLETLHLISVQFPREQSWIESLFSNSPNLETLTIHNCNFGHLRVFQILALKLKNLIIIQDEAAPSSYTNRISSMTKISTPNLISLKLHLQIESRWYFLDDKLDSLVEANIHIKKVSSQFSLVGFMVGIFSQLQNAKAITLSGSCLELLGEGLIFSPKPPTNPLRLRFIKSKENLFSNFKLMKLKTWFEDEEAGAITNLLKRTPNIETLVIEYNSESSESSYKGEKLSQKEVELPSVCELPHLKTIQMRGFAGRKNEVKLASFLLDNAKSLEKMTMEKASV